MNWVKIVLKTAGVIGAIYGGYELGEGLASGRAAGTVKVLMDEMTQLKQLLGQQKLDSQATLDGIQITILSLAGGVTLAFIVGMALFTIKSTRKCITKSVESAVDPQS